jgi:serine/threonine protein kinase
MGDRVIAPRAVGRYVLFDEVASGGMATVHFGRMTGAAGFTRTVAIKRLHANFAKDPDFVSMLIDEARLAARIAHPNVVSTIDVVSDEGEILLIMDYVAGASLSHLSSKVRSKGGKVPPAIGVSILIGALYGLQAAHEARSDAGEPLDVVHRDVSPQNILVGIDGVARVVDFGVAKAIGRLQTTREGQLKGKAAYMAPEQIRGLPVDRRTDVYAASVVLWETLVGERLFSSPHAMGVMNAVFEKRVPPVSEACRGVPVELDAIVAKGLSRDPDLRFPTATAMAVALEGALRPASIREVGDWVGAEASDTLARRAHRIAEIESSSGGGDREGSILVPELEVSTSASHVSNATPRRRGGVWILVVSIVGLCAIATCGLLWWRWRPAITTVSNEAVVPSAPFVSPEPQSSATSSASPSAAASLPLPPLPQQAGVPLPASRPALPVPRSTISRPKPGTNPHGPSCNPPYTIDVDGTRRWKDGC